MCGIAGMVDLSGSRPVPPGALQRMAQAIYHRGPDEDGFLEQAGLGLANRRLSIVGLADGRQPIRNEDGNIVVVFNGEFFDYPEVKNALQTRGHHFRTHCDTEIIPHLWEDHGEGMFEHLRGQFALALWDQQRRTLILARDRFGICPLFWTRQDDWLLFASEIKALLASGLVPARPDVRGIDQVFNFFAVPGPHTCFAGVQALQPGHYMRVRLDQGPPQIRTYWKIDFPLQGEEERENNPRKLVDRFEEAMLGAVERRLRADVPVVSYLSGGIDSSLVVAMAAKIRGTPIPTFTIQVMVPHLDETSQAAVVSRHIGSQPIVVQCGDRQIIDQYPQLIWAAEAPVVDTSCTGLLMLARSVHDNGYKVALTGEGSDEWLAGYVWFKTHRLMSLLDIVPGLDLGTRVRTGLTRLAGGPPEASAHLRKVSDLLGHHTPYHDLYGIMGLNRWWFFSQATHDALKDYMPYLELEPDLGRMRRWHPLNRAFYWAGRIHLPGHLLSLKGDRVAMNSSVETRYPFLDENVFNFLAGIHPRWKLHGFQDKYILRLLGERYLPREVAWRPKGMFRAPRDSFFDHGVPAYVDQLLSEESLKKTGYFDPKAVHHWHQAHKNHRISIRHKAIIELGLVAVVSTQLWHHTFIDASLADIPSPRAQG